MDITATKDFFIEKLNRELKPDLYYHSIRHTLDVHDAAVKIAEMENVNGHDMVLLRTAAYLHDAGLINTYIGHEEASVVIAKEYLPKFGYSVDDIDIVSAMILTTKLPQKANTKFEQILCDADLDYLGRDDFFMIAHRLRCEWNIYNSQTSLKEWYQIQIKFLEGHTYFTESARKLRCEKKKFNLDQIKEVIGV
ncbi:MAG: HD domain-containing protein [Bacteroidales bacterium]|nr:HD domain-containing protein [Bacteroidales bacterium]